MKSSTLLSSSIVPTLTNFHGFGTLRRTLIFGTRETEVWGIRGDPAVGQGSAPVGVRRWVSRVDMRHRGRRTRTSTSRAHPTTPTTPNPRVSTVGGDDHGRGSRRGHLPTTRATLCGRATGVRTAYGVYPWTLPRGPSPDRDSPSAVPSSTRV